MDRRQTLFSADRVYLSALDEDDASVVARWYDDPKFARMYDAEPARPKTSAEIAETIREWRQSDTAVMFGIRRQGDDVLIGIGGLDSLSWRNRVGWLAVALDSDYWGDGLGSEATALLVRYAFDEMNLYRVQLTVFAHNERALNMYRRLGFRQEGTFREFLERDGRRYDMFLMGMLAPEWRGQEARSADPL